MSYPQSYSGYTSPSAPPVPESQPGWAQPYSPPPNTYTHGQPQGNYGSYGYPSFLRPKEFAELWSCLGQWRGLTEKFKEKDLRYTGSATFTYDAFMSMIIPFLV